MFVLLTVTRLAGETGKQNKRLADFRLGFDPLCTRSDERLLLRSCFFFSFSSWQPLTKVLLTGWQKVSTHSPGYRVFTRGTSTRGNVGRQRDRPLCPTPTCSPAGSALKNSPNRSGCRSLKEQTLAFYISRWRNPLRKKCFSM